jgi:hypothetical protein
MISAMHPGGAELYIAYRVDRWENSAAFGCTRGSTHVRPCRTVIGEVHKDLGALTPFWPPSAFALVHNSLI